MGAHEGMRGYCGGHMRVRGSTMGAHEGMRGYHGGNTRV